MFWAILLTVVTVAFIAWFVLDRVRHEGPEDAASHSFDPSERRPKRDRPAGPGAEAENVVERGEHSPGP